MKIIQNNLKPQLTVIGFLLFLSFSSSAGFLDSSSPLTSSPFMENPNISRDDFNRIIDEVAKPYKPIIADHGAKLIVVKDWESQFDNAVAEKAGNEWSIKMFGGFARRPEMTQDGFALMVCHEIGHHLAGFPFMSPQGTASEGAADYFASHVCARKIWGPQHEKNAEFRDIVHEVPEAKCNKVWKKQSERDLCYRIATAAEASAKAIAAARKTFADFDRRDESVVETTYFKHPRPQCRLQTYLAGALCTKEFSPSIIPGRNEHKSQDWDAAEREASRLSCSKAGLDRIEGLRPSCWYKPSLKTLLVVDSVELKERKGSGNGAIDSNESGNVVVKIRNLADNAYQNVVGSIVSIRNKFEVLRGKVSYQTVEKKTSKVSNDLFEIKLGPLQCGEKYDFQIMLSLGDNQGDIFKHTAIAGKFLKTKTLNKNVNTPIPNGDSAGLTSKLKVSGAEGYKKARITVDITHDFNKDLSITLISPEGRIFPLFSRFTHIIVFTEDLKRTFEVELPAELEKNGEWSLNIVDDPFISKGKLNSWSLDFTKVVCE